MTTAFVRVPKGADLRPALAGLPGDLCQCPHWGYLLKGRVQMHTRNGEQIYEAGQAFYWAPGTRPRRSRTPSTWTSRPRTSSTTYRPHQGTGMSPGVSRSCAADDACHRARLGLDRRR